MYLHVAECSDWAQCGSRLISAQVACTIIWCFFVNRWFSQLQRDDAETTTTGMRVRAFIVTKDEPFTHTRVYAFSNPSFTRAMRNVFIPPHHCFWPPFFIVLDVSPTNAEWYFPFATVASSVTMLFFDVTDVAVERIYFINSAERIYSKGVAKRTYFKDVLLRSYFKDCFALIRYFLTISTIGIRWEYCHHQAPLYFNAFELSSRIVASTCFHSTLISLLVTIFINLRYPCWGLLIITSSCKVAGPFVKAQ